MTALANDTLAQPSVTPSNRLRATMAAARLSFTWMGVRKSLNARQRTQAADAFDAEGKYLSASKKLLDTTHPAFRDVTAIKGRAQAYWKGMSLPFPDPGVRLIRQDSIEDFDKQIGIFQYELELAVEELDRHYGELRSAAQNRLGALFDSSDYPPSLVGTFAIEHDYPAIEAPRFLEQLNPELYEQECQRVQARFDDAVALAETAFVEEFTKLIDHLVDRLAGHDDGKPKIFRDSAVTNLHEFFERFQQLNIRSNDQLDSLVADAQAIVNGVDPNHFRRVHDLRSDIGARIASVQSSLDELLVDRPRRNILRRPH